MPAYTFSPLTTKNWQDFEQLFGRHGACGGCWCMWWRLKSSEFEQNKGEGNRLAIKSLVESGEVPGLLAYKDGKAVGWCAVQPRSTYAALERSRILKPVDQQPVWSVTCFFIERKRRRQGITVELLKAAIEYVGHHGGCILEGYPVEPKQNRVPDPFVFTGLVSAFKKAGFQEADRRSETRPIMRYKISG